MGRTKKEIQKDFAAATAKPKEQVIEEHIDSVGSVPMLTGPVGDEEHDPGFDDEPGLETGAENPTVVPVHERRENQMVFGEVISTDGQMRRELFSFRGTIDGRRVMKSQEITTGVRTLVWKVLIPIIETPQHEEIRVSLENSETEAAQAGNMEPAMKKCKEMGCDRVELRGRGLVFIRHQKKFRFIPES